MKFRKTYIEITNRCNLSCAFCPKTSREPLFMDEGLFDSICSQLRGRTERLYFHVVGEPLMHPRLPVFLDISEFYAHKVHLVTNGLELAKHCDGLALKPALKQLNISLHSFTGGMNEGPLRAYFDAIKHVVDTFAGSNRIVQLRLWNKGLGDPSLHSLEMRLIRETFGLSSPVEDLLAKRRSAMLGKNLCIDSTAPFEWPALGNREHGGHGTCYGLRRQCAVLAEGTVTACCLDNNGILNLGNVRERPLAGILSGKRAIAIREGFERGVVVEELCRKCSYRLRFMAEPKNASSP